MKISGGHSQGVGQIHAHNASGSDSAPLLKPVLDGDRLRWSQEITRPMKMTVDFDLTRDGDKLNGKAKAGFFPGMDVVGERVR